MKKIVEDRFDCMDILFEKFTELSEMFSNMKDSESVELEQKFYIIKSMLEIYNTLFHE